MKTKIISIALLLVMIALTFTGCAYNYQKKDLSAYATFNNSAFKTAIENLKIADGEFSHSEDDRQASVAKKIQTSLSSALASVEENKKTSGTMSAGSVVTYCFYNEVEVESGAKFFNMSKMNTTSTSSIVLTDDDNEIDNAIRAALRGKDLTGKNYTAKTSGTVAETDTKAIVSYTRDEVTDGGSPVTKEYVNSLETVGGEDGSFGKALVGKTIGTKFATGADEDANIVVEDGTVTYTYKDVTVNYVVSGEEFLAADIKPYTEDATVTDLHKNTIPVNKDSAVKYHIYVINFAEVPDYAAFSDTDAAAAIIFDILGAKITKNDLDVFTNADYKYDKDGTNVTLESIITGIGEKFTAIDTAKKAYDDAAEEDKEAKKSALDEAKAALDRTALMEEINKCNAEMSKLIREAYAKKLYDEAESSYKSDIENKIVKAVWEKVQANLTVPSAPKKAVKDAYKTNLAAYKYNYYTASTESVKNTEKYSTFDAYLESVATSLKGTTVSGKKAVKEVLMEEAEGQIKEVLQVYVLAKAVNEIYSLKGTDDELKVAGSDVENYAAYMAQIQYYYTGSSVSTEQVKEMYGEENIKTYILFDRTMAYLTETDENASETDKSVKFKHVVYDYE